LKEKVAQVTQVYIKLMQQYPPAGFQTSNEASSVLILISQSADNPPFIACVSYQETVTTPLTEIISFVAMVIH
jgi:hypothetical protein